MPYSFTDNVSQSYLEENWKFGDFHELGTLSPDKREVKMRQMLRDMACDMSRMMEDVRALGEYCRHLEQLVDRNAHAHAPHAEIYFSKCKALGGIVRQRDVYEDHVFLIKNPTAERD